MGNSTLDVTWRQYDGAIVQAVWKKDGARFFPAAGKEAEPEFIGIGGAETSVFTGEPRVEELDGRKTVIFSNREGESLEYGLPDGGCVMDVRWVSPTGNSFYLVRAIKDIPQLWDPHSGKSYPANPLRGLENGRVFSIWEGKVQASRWGQMLKDPWFGFLGRKRKILPPASDRLGMDAGIETSGRRVTHYFAAIWDSEQPPFSGAVRSPGFLVKPDAGGHARARLYLGPKQAESLASFHPAGQPEKGEAFKQAMDFGFFGLIAKFMFAALRAIQSKFHNWGWSLMVFGVLVRAALWPLNNKMTLNQLRQKDLEPHQKKIQAKYEKYGRDMAKKAEMQRELQAFWKKNGHNPMGGCLTSLIQFPVFMALWSMLQNVFELRHAPWIFWIRDLSTIDPLYILPAMMALTMMARSAMMPATGDPQQRRMMMVFMPVMMGVMFAFITPAGLMIYYMSYNVVDMAQVWLLTRRYKPQPVVV